jgi:hypothetical protein
MRIVLLTSSEIKVCRIPQHFVRHAFHYARDDLLLLPFEMRSHLLVERGLALRAARRSVHQVVADHFGQVGVHVLVYLRLEIASRWAKWCFLLLRSSCVIELDGEPHSTFASSRDAEKSIYTVKCAARHPDYLLENIAEEISTE